MSKNFFYIYILILFSIIFIVKTEEDPKESENYDYDYDDGYSNDYFKETLKQYLIERKLFDSEEPVKPEEMKKIFLEVITEGDAESSAEYFGGIFNELADYFVNSYYVNRKEIKGKQIYDLIDLNQISSKFEEMIGHNPEFNPMYDNNFDDSDENSDDDPRDNIGESTPDV